MCVALTFISFNQGINIFVLQAITDAKTNYPIPSFCFVNEQRVGTKSQSVFICRKY